MKKTTKTENTTMAVSTPSVIIRPYVSEKSQRGLAANQYSFLVDSRANKVLVKREVEAKHGVHVVSVTMTAVRVKPARYRGKLTYFKNAKKATVRVKDGERIDTA